MSDTPSALSAALAETNRLLARLAEHFPPPCAAPEAGCRVHRWTAEQGFQAVQRPRLMEPGDLLHVEAQAQTLYANTAQLLAGRPANHALLWGARGTGKSSLIRSLPAVFADAPLGLVEIGGGDLKALPRLLAGLPEDGHWILFADDLSFNAADPSYTALKALLDGSLAAAPDHVRIYATSNRRHLMPEAAADNLAATIEDGELHPGEAVEEKISLSERFGVWLAFHPFSQDQYLDCVHHWLRRLEVAGDAPQALDADALRWARRRGARNGRVAYQFAVAQIGRAPPPA